MKPNPTILLIFLLIWGNILFGYETHFKQPIKPLIQESRLYLNSKSVMPYTPHYQVLGSLIGIDRIIKQANLTPYAELNRIIWYESSNDPTAKNPNSSAWGLCQVISSTKLMIEKGLDEKIDWDNKDDQIKACIWLYKNSNKYKEWKETEPLWNVDN